ncbi:unnamed protein product [Cuscuta epithymum]|uniref:HMA domain-containing protein n=2 Tax=Cuscuta epithymum TaxID=186058 RepID=A0AAV0FZA7_9ASTE|nr:unnamed protein product [Cuscuta epithymum]
MAAVNTPAKPDLAKTYFDVLGICCSSEIPLIEKILKPLEGVRTVSVVVASKTLIVVHDPALISDQQIVRALNKARLEASIRVNGVRKQWQTWPSPYAIVCVILLLLSLLKYVYEPLKWLAVGAAVVGAVPITLKAVVSLRNLNIDINILMLIAVVGSLFLSDYREAATIVFLFTISEWLQSCALHQAKDVMLSLVNVVPQKAILAETGEELLAGDVKLNSILAVKAGEIIPIDGTVVDGECEVDEKIITGESFPVAKQKNSTVLAGSINLNGYITIKTTALAKECLASRMPKLIEDAQTNKSKTQRYIDQIAKYYTPVVVAVFIVLVILPSVLRLHNRKWWYHLALVVLVSACPCALVLSTPAAMFCALSMAATSGLLFKSTDCLETLAKIRIMAFDKTGTLTRGEFSVTQFKTFLQDVNHDTLLYWVSSIEAKSSHPMATALIDYACLHSVAPKPDRVEQFENFPGEGIYGRIDGREIFIGNKKIFSRAQCNTVPELEGDGYEGKSISYIFSGSCLVGLFSLADNCRTGAKEALVELKSLGVKGVMLTGDCYSAASHVQEQLGGALDDFHAELLPEGKAKFIKEFQKEARTGMIGDGLNDAVALATADVGISMGVSGSALAMETGNIILISNDLRKLPYAIRLARRVKRKVVENVILSITIKVAILALAISGHPLVWAAVFADVGSCLIVVMNSFLLLRGRTARQGKNKYCKSSSVSHHRHGKSSHSHQQPCCKSPKSVSASGNKKLKCTINSHHHDEHSNSDIEHDHCTPNQCGGSLRIHNHHLSNNTVVEEKHHENDNHNCCGSTSLDLEKNDSCNNHHCEAEETHVGDHPTECSSTHTSAVNIKNNCHDHVDRRAALKTLQTQHLGACSQSCKNECGDKDFHLGSKSGGKLSEIVISN